MYLFVNFFIFIVNSCPYKGNPASSRKISREPKPHGIHPFRINCCHTLVVIELSRSISKPVSPVYPV